MSGYLLERITTMKQDKIDDSLVSSGFSPAVDVQ